MFHNACSLLQNVDLLPSGPSWHCELIGVKGNETDGKGALLTDTLELWWRDPVECVCALMGNPAFQGSMVYAPEKVYTNGKCDTAIIDDAWTASWWWDTQVRLILSCILD